MLEPKEPKMPDFHRKIDISEDIGVDLGEAPLSQIIQLYNTFAEKHDIDVETVTYYDYYDYDRSDEHEYKLYGAHYPTAAEISAKVEAWAVEFEAYVEALEAYHIERDIARAASDAQWAIDLEKNRAKRYQKYLAEKAYYAEQGMD